jgi:hypothetical protein
LLERAVINTSSEGHNIVQVMNIVRAPARSVAAYMFCSEIDCKKIQRAEQHATDIWEIVEHNNYHSLVLHFGLDLPQVKNRDGVFRCIYRELPDGDIIISIHSILHPGVPVQDGVVRVFGKRLLR